MARSPRRRTAEAAIVGALAVGFGTWAAVASRWLHPHLTRNADEATYLQQGAVLASGHLTATPPGDLRAFQPWFATVRDGRYVFKYTLVWPAVLAFGRVLGSPRVGLFVAAAAAVVGVYLLAREILGSHRRALAATVLVMVAPLVTVDATTFLPYVWFSALWTFTAWAALRAARSRRPWFALAAGVLAGLTFFARPYEALFVLGPFGVWLLWDGRREARGPRPAGGLDRGRRRGAARGVRRDQRRAHRITAAHDAHGVGPARPSRVRTAPHPRHRAAPDRLHRARRHRGVGEAHGPTSSGGAPAEWCSAPSRSEASSSAGDAAA